MTRSAPMTRDQKHICCRYSVFRDEVWISCGAKTGWRANHETGPEEIESQQEKASHLFVRSTIHTGSYVRTHKKGVTDDDTTPRAIGLLRERDAICYLLNIQY